MPETEPAPQPEVTEAPQTAETPSTSTTPFGRAYQSIINFRNRIEQGASSIRANIRGKLDKVLRHEEPELPSDSDTLIKTTIGTTADAVDASAGTAARIADKGASPLTDVAEAASDIPMRPLSNLNIFNGRLLANLLRGGITAPVKAVTQTAAGVTRGADDIVHRGAVRPTHRWGNKLKYIGGSILSWAAKKTQKWITTPLRKGMDFLANKIFGKPDDWAESFQKWSRT